MATTASHIHRHLYFCDSLDRAHANLLRLLMTYMRVCLSIHASMSSTKLACPTRDLLYCDHPAERTTHCMYFATKAELRDDGSAVSKFLELIF